MSTHDDPVITVFPPGHRLAGRPAWLIEGVYLPAARGGDGTAVLDPPATNPVLVATRDRRMATQVKLDEITIRATKRAEADPKAAVLTDDETAEFEKLAKRIDKLDRDIANLEAEEKRKDAAATAAATLKPGEGVVRRENHTYEAWMVTHPNAYNRGNSFMLDLGILAANRQLPGAGETVGGADGASERLAQHSKELSIDAKTDKRLAAAIHEIRSTPRDMAAREEARMNEGGLEVRVNPNTTLGTGGEFVPPLWLINQYIPFQRPGRVCVNRSTILPLPPGISVINLPKIGTALGTTGGSLAGIQTGQGVAVASQDIVTSTVAATVHTIAGQEDISLQLLEQSPIAMDGVVFDDITRDYDQRLDIQFISGTGLNGQHLGVDAVTSPNTPTFTSASMVPGTSAGLFNAVANGMMLIHTLRFDRATGIWMHPRRWFFALATAVDSNNRPLIVPIQNQPWNAAGVSDNAPVQGHAGWLWLGLPVFIDANIPTTVSATQDEVIVAKEDDLYTWEGTMRMRALPEVLSGTLQIRFQVYAYGATMPHRFPPSISLLRGAGGAAPSF